jgi:serine/threonine protein kinase
MMHPGAARVVRKTTTVVFFVRSSFRFHPLDYEPVSRRGRQYFKATNLTNETVKVNKGYFHLENRLGEGGFGVVYSARDTSNSE